ncbi:hypothetical protein C6503_08955 [Candidatus Poribacteria bacterium]|nr:MAG: hypothetical protein C6503_08955 [Candidatus Poribacteria bacterium]
MLKKFLIFAICIGICFIIFFFYQQVGNRSEHKETASHVYDYQPSTGLPPQETQMFLKHFNSKVAAREAKLKSGVIEFSITKSREQSSSAKSPVYKERLKWDITYRFSGQQRFYKIVERVRVKPGWFRRAIWKESKRYEFQEDSDYRYGRVNRGDGWQWTSRAPLELGDYYNPFYWAWNSNLTQMVQMFGPIIETRSTVGDKLHDYIKFERWGTDKIEITEFWFDPWKDYRTTRILQQTRYIRYIKRGTTDRTLLSSGAPITTEKLSPQMRQINYTYQLAQFAPDIWFPQTATFLTGRKLELQVHSASFNTPILVKDLQLFPDR